MRILQFSATRFRSLRKVESWQPGALNVLIGPNGSGKSNVLRAIDLLAASAQGRLSRVIQSFGGMDPLLWDGQESDFEIKIECSATEDDRTLQPPLSSALAYDLRVRRLGKGGDFEVAFEQLSNSGRKMLEHSGQPPNALAALRTAARPVQTKSSPSLKGKYAGPRVKSAVPIQSGQPFQFLERNGTRVRIFDGQRGLVAIEGDIPAQETIISLAKGPFTLDRTLSQFRAHLAGFSVYHDLHTNQDAAIRQPAITRHEKRVDADGQNLISVLHTLYTGDRDFKNEINDAMTAAFGDDFEELVFAPAADQRIQLRLRWKSLRREQSAADLSDGTLRFLFLLTVLASPDPAPVIAIDEPETGLHPSMLPIVAEYAVQASKRAQVIFTTHSPQFLDAFTDTRPQTTVVQRLEGETHLKTLDPEQMNGWLQEYSLGSLFRSGELEAMA